MKMLIIPFENAIFPNRSVEMKRKSSKNNHHQLLFLIG